MPGTNLLLLPTLQANLTAQLKTGNELAILAARRLISQYLRGTTTGLGITGLRY